MSNKRQHKNVDERLEFGERLRFFRKNILKMRRAAFCEKFGVKPMTLKSWEILGARISKRNITYLEDSFRQLGVLCDYDWLFLGIEKNNITDHKTRTSVKNEHRFESVSSTDLVYHITSFCYEPIWKKNAKFWLESIDLTDLNSPSFAMARDQHEIMHIGITMLSSNNAHILNAYKGSFYKIVLNETYDIFLIKKLIM